MTDTPHRDAARKMPDALSSPVIDTFGPGMTAFIDTLGPKPGDTSWMTALGPDTYAPGALSTIADTVLGMKNFDGLGIKEFGLAPGAGPGMTAFIDTLGPKPGDT
ncbi:hypothetical protein, partial [Mycolicibacterium sp.]|uniref:hypothetical protein n=1 Tax=Mycolicibacterium sp. TaxID=2320850 RepID=UPI001A227237